jgi:hypothetical protein
MRLSDVVDALVRIQAIYGDVEVHNTENWNPAYYARVGEVDEDGKFHFKPPLNEEELGDR